MDYSEEECPHGMERAWCSLCRARDEARLAAADAKSNPGAGGSKSRSRGRTSTAASRGTQRPRPAAATTAHEDPNRTSWIPGSRRASDNSATGAVDVGTIVRIAGYPATLHAEVAEIDGESILVKWENGTAMRVRRTDVTAVD